MIPVISDSHPGKTIYSVFNVANSSKLAGNPLYFVPSALRYPTPILICLRGDRMSTLVKLIELKPFIAFEYLKIFASNHPTLLCLPVVTPNSKPF